MCLKVRVQDYLLDCLLFVCLHFLLMPGVMHLDDLAVLSWLALAMRVTCLSPA